MSKIEKNLSLLGLTATDCVTGFKGVVTSVSFDLFGCIQAVVTPPAGENGKQEDSRWYDVARLKISVTAERVMPVPDYENISVADGEKGPAEKPAM